MKTFIQLFAFLTILFFNSTLAHSQSVNGGNNGIHIVITELPDTFALGAPVTLRGYIQNKQAEAIIDDRIELHIEATNSFFEPIPSSLSDIMHDIDIDYLAQDSIYPFNFSFEAEEGHYDLYQNIVIVWPKLGSEDVPAGSNYDFDYRQVYVLNGEQSTSVIAVPDILEVEDYTSVENWFVMDLMGRIIHQENKMTKQRIDLTEFDLSGGLYLVHIKRKNSRENKMIFINR